MHDTHTHTHTKSIILTGEEVAVSSLVFRNINFVCPESIVVIILLIVITIFTRCIPSEAKLFVDGRVGGCVT